MQVIQTFGSNWTIQKLEAVENYIKAYLKIMKNQNFKTCYIDAFAGSGKVKLKTTGEVYDGSAVRALKYDFDKYFFFEIDSDNYKSLKEKVDLSGKQHKVKLFNTDCLKMLQMINQKDWRKDGWRGVIFLDPYKMSVPWECLEKINSTKIFDVWYLFPFYAVNRNVAKDNTKIADATKLTLGKIFGDSEWEDKMYKEVPQGNLFGFDEVKKEDTEGIKQYIIDRLKTTFPTVAKNPALLKNSTNAPLFLLCFAGSNESVKAKAASLGVANHILKNIE